MDIVIRPSPLSTSRTRSSYTTEALCPSNASSADPQPPAPTILPSVSTNLTPPATSEKGNHVVSVFLWLTISRSKMSSRFICIVAYVRSTSQVVKNPPADGGDTRDPGGIPGPGSPGGNGSPLHCSCLETSMDRGAWRAAVHRVTKSRTRLSGLAYTHQKKLACWHLHFGPVGLIFGLLTSRTTTYVCYFKPLNLC